MSWIREQKLLRLIYVLWNQATPNTQAILIPYIEREGMAWAVSLDEYIEDDDWFTPDLLALHLGLSESTIRNWPRRYGLKPNSAGQYRWGDVQAMKVKRNRRNADKNVA